MTAVSTHAKLADGATAGLAARLAIRRRDHLGPTSGLAPGFAQANLAILPRALAADFARFCALNPKPCPLIGVAAPGDWRIPALGEDLDIRTDVPRYRVWRDGTLVDEPQRSLAMVAGRSGQLRHRLLVLLRAGLDRSGPRNPPYHLQLHGADVSHVDPDGAVRAVPRATGRFDAAVQARGCHPRDRDHQRGTRWCTARRSTSAGRN